MIKNNLKKVARTMAGWPVVGRFVRIGIAVIRFPKYRNAYLDLQRQQLTSGNGMENFTKSVPVALREITREVIEMREQLRNVSSSVEFTRLELMFAMRYEVKKSIAGVEQIKTKTEIINPEKLVAARNERLCLNLGCGHIALAGYLNVDGRTLPGVDIVSGVDELPFQQGEVDEIFSAHLLEHFPQEQLRRELLPYWVSLLKSGGTFSAVVPDAESMIKGYVDGSYPYSCLREVTFGRQEYQGNFHFNMFVTDQLEELLEEVGLHGIEWKAKGRRNGNCYEMEFRAFKK